MCSPLAMAGQPWACGGVASGNDDSNQARTAGEKGASGSGAATPSRYRRPLTAAVRDGSTRWTPAPVAARFAQPTVSVPTMLGWRSQMYS